MEELAVDDGGGVEEEAYVDEGGASTDVSDLMRILSALEERASYGAQSSASHSMRWIEADAYRWQATRCIDEWLRTQDFNCLVDG